MTTAANCINCPHNIQSDSHAAIYERLMDALDNLYNSTPSEVELQTELCRLSGCLS